MRSKVVVLALVLALILVPISALAYIETFTIDQNGVNCESGDCRPLELGFNHTMDHTILSMYWAGKCWDYNSGVNRTGYIVEYYNHSNRIARYTLTVDEINKIYTDCTLYYEFDQGYNLSSGLGAIYNDWENVPGGNLLLFLGHGTNFTDPSITNYYFFNHSNRMLYAFPPSHPIAAGYYEIEYTTEIPGMVPNFTISVSPHQAAIGDPVTITAQSSNSDFSSLTAYTIICSLTTGGSTVSCGSNGNPIAYAKKYGDWYQWNGTTSEYDINVGSFPTNIITSFSEAGNITIAAAFWPPIGYEVQNDSDYVEINESATKKTVIFSVRDFLDGSLIIPSSVQVINKVNDSWSNATTIAGFRTMLIPAGNMIGWTGAAPGYLESPIVYSLITGNRDIPITLTKTINFTEGNNTLYVTVIDADNHIVLPGATVSLNDGQSKITSSQGTASFMVLNMAEYQVTAGKSGFQSQTSTLMIANLSNGISFDLHHLTGPTPTATGTGGGAQPTLDTRDNNQKGSDMVKMIYDNGESLIMLMVLATVIGLVKMMGKR